MTPSDPFALLDERLVRFFNTRAEVAAAAAPSVDDAIFALDRRLSKSRGPRLLRGGTLGRQAPAIGWRSVPVIYLLVAFALIIALIAIAVGAGALPLEPFRAVVQPSLPTLAVARVDHHNGAITIALATGVMSIDPTTGSQRTIKTGPIEYADWSPDGSRLALVDTSRLFVLDTASGVRAPVTNDLVVDAPIAWSPDGTRIAYGALDGLHVVVVASGQDTLVPGTAVATGAASFPQGRPSWTPDGREVRFTTVQGPPAVFGVDGSGYRLLPTIGSFGSVPTWSPDGTKVAYLADPLETPPARGGDPFVLQLWVANADGTHPTKLFERPGCCVARFPIGPVWSPDGTKIALDVFELWVIDAASGHALNLGAVPDGDLGWRPAQ
jgi:sugar lactone lactonase YvrE